MYKINKNEDYLTSFNFARKSDLVFSEVLSTDQFYDIKSTNLKINFKNSDITSYKVKKFVLNQGDIIFSNSAAVKSLFRYLKNVDQSYNLQLITHQADYPIDRKLYLNKPKSISKWYAINVDFIAEDLIPIPLGIANDYSTKNLRTSHFTDHLLKISKQKELKLYINLVKSTNYQERGNLFNNFLSSDWVVLREPTLSLDDYYKDLQKYQFVLCPWGNGFDTHRLWETLYSGSVPVVKYHQTYSNLKDLPIIFYENVEDLNLKFLCDQLEYLDFNNLEKLSSQYWFDIIKSNQEKGPLTMNINEKNVRILYKIFWKN